LAVAFLPRAPEAALLDLAPRLPPLAFDPPRAELFLALVEPDLPATFFAAGFFAAADFGAGRALPDFMPPGDFPPDAFTVGPPDGRDDLVGPPVFAREAVEPLLAVRAPELAPLAGAMPVAAPVF